MMRPSWPATHRWPQGATPITQEEREYRQPALFIDEIERAGKGYCFAVDLIKAFR